ncbi:MAG: hypothetical protein IPQ06_08490 [Chitinophagaceae bacterium]|nr:hypothetical protein [Chitinophagaceae bacterium]
MFSTYLRLCVLLITSLQVSLLSSAQNKLTPKYSNSTIYTGIEVGSKGVKMSVIEIGKNAQSTGAFNILKDSSVNTDFISFSEPTFQATLTGLCGLYTTATKEYKIPAKRVFTVISSGVKMQAEKDSKFAWINSLIDSFRIKINEPNRTVEVVDVLKEALFSHLGIVPETRRFTTFLIDIGSGNTKGGFFPYGNTTDFKLFQLNWGTKSTANATEKNCADDKSLPNYNKQLYRVLSGAENSEIIYAVNSSGAYPVSDNIAISGGIAWALATLTHPELLDNSVISVSFDEILKFSEKLFKNYAGLTPEFLAGNINRGDEKAAAIKEIKRVQQVFDQKAMMAGTGLLLKIMRQFASAFESKQFYLVKNGQVGWVSAYVDQAVEK